MTRMILVVWGLVACLIVAGCQTAPQFRVSAGQEPDPLAIALSAPQTIDALSATCVPPLGWTPKPLEQSHRHAHQVWISPTGHTAYGIIRFNLPFPVPADWLVEPFLDEMKKKEPDARLIGPINQDKELGGVRFIAQSHHYTMRIHLTCWAFKGWVLYAGTRTGQPEDPAELQLAELAREHTIVPALPSPAQQARVIGPTPENVREIAP